MKEVKVDNIEGRMNLRSNILRDKWNNDICIQDYIDRRIEKKNYIEKYKEYGCKTMSSNDRTLASKNRAQ